MWITKKHLAKRDKGFHLRGLNLGFRLGFAAGLRCKNPTLAEADEVRMKYQERLKDRS